MTGNGIESDFVLPDSLFISDYSTLPAFYPHFGANCRFFCTISISPDSSAPFCSPNDTRGAASGLPFARLSCVHLHTVPACLLGEHKGRCPLTPQGTSSLDPSARLGCAHLHTVSACLFGEPLTQKSRPCLQGQPF